MKFKDSCNIFIFFTVFLLVSLKTALANNPETNAYQRGNVYYEQGNFDEAIKQYNSILDAGFENGNLYYNLGNCFFKKGELGRAILNYEKARRLIPMDKDLESNYEYACSLIKGESVSSKRSLLLRVLNGVFDKFTIDGLTIFLSVLYILILISILFGIFFRNFKKHAFIVAIVIGLFFVLGTIGLKGKVSLLNKEAVVIAKIAEVRFEPMDNATTYFTLYEGMKVRIIASKDNWYKVRRRDGKSGWVQNDSIAIF